MTNDQTRWVLGHQVTPIDTTADYDLMIAHTPAKMPGPPPHLHNSYSEVFLIVEGEMDFVVNGQPRTLKAGESLDLPPNTVHTFANNSDAPCKWINIHSPKGFRAFFEKMGIPASEEAAQEQSLNPELIQQVIETAADFDMQIQMESAR